jgi:putative transposase
MDKPRLLVIGGGVNGMTALGPERSHRHSIRLKGYDYSQAGGYFITIVSQLRECFFGKICAEEMVYNEAGKMVACEWSALPERFPNIQVDIFQVMPNHFHGLLIIHAPVGAGLVPARLVPAREGATTRVAPTIGEVVGAFKSITTHKYILGVEKFAWPAFTKRLWQRNYYEHILRDQADYERVAAYIYANPANWGLDKENISNPAGKRLPSSVRTRRYDLGGDCFVGQSTPSSQRHATM